MAVVDAEIVVYGSTTMAEDDTTTQIGGAINTAVEVIFTDIDVAGTVEALSDGTDTRDLTITYYTASGVKASETKTLTSGTAVGFSATMDAIVKMVLSSSDGSRTVTVRKSSAGATLKTIGPNVTTVKRVFYDALANASGATKKFYEKVFFKNTNSTDDLSTASISEQADPGSVVAFALESSLDGTGDNGASNTRLTAPSGFTFDSTAKNVANGGVLEGGTAQGVWLELTLVAGAAPADTSFTLRLTGVTA